MAGKLLRFVNGSVLNPITNRRGNHLKVGAPTFALVNCAARPPAVFVRVFVVFSKRVHIANLIEHLAQPLPLVWQKARLVFVVVAVGNIPWRVRHGPVTAKNELSALAGAFFQMSLHIVKKADFDFLGFSAGGGAWSQK